MKLLENKEVQNYILSNKLKAFYLKKLSFFFKIPIIKVNKMNYMCFLIIFSFSYNSALEIPLKKRFTSL